MQENENTSEMAKPRGISGYDPADDKNWHQELIKPDQPKGSLLKVIFAVFSIPIFIFIFFGLPGLIILGISMHGRNTSIPKETAWSEAKTAVATIKTAVDSYKVRNGGDISGLDKPKGKLKEGFLLGSGLLEDLRLDDLAFEQLEYFDADDFNLEFITDGTDGKYIITVEAEKSGGLTNEGPEGSGTYDSVTGYWTGDLE